MGGNPLGCGLPNADAVAILCWQETYRPWGAPLPPSNTDGQVVFTVVSGELVEPFEFSAVYTHVSAARDYIWASWHSATLAELIETCPDGRAAGSSDLSRGWW